MFETLRITSLLITWISLILFVLISLSTNSFWSSFNELYFSPKFKGSSFWSSLINLLSSSFFCSGSLSSLCLGFFEFFSFKLISFSSPIKISFSRFKIGSSFLFTLIPLFNSISSFSEETSSSFWELVSMSLSILSSRFSLSKLSSFLFKSSLSSSNSFRSFSWFFKISDSLSIFFSSTFSSLFYFL